MSVARISTKTDDAFRLAGVTMPALNADYHPYSLRLRLDRYGPWTHSSARDCYLLLLADVSLSAKGSAPDSPSVKYVFGEQPPGGLLGLLKYPVYRHTAICHFDGQPHHGPSSLTPSSGPRQHNYYSTQSDSADHTQVTLGDSQKPVTTMGNSKKRAADEQGRKKQKINPEK